MLVLLSTATSVWAQSDPFADAVVEYLAGRNGGFGEESLPGVILGPPRGNGRIQGSTDVLSLGDAGSVTLRFDSPVICDGEGSDFTVFENAFFAGELVFAEVATVEVSQDGIEFHLFPFDPISLEGLAGTAPVFSHPDNGIAPTDPAVSGGDTFDLATVGLPWAAFVRLTDAAQIDDPGNSIPPGISAGFDLDAVAAVHSCAASVVTPTVTTRPSPTATIAPPDGDLDANGTIDLSDLTLLLAEIFDGDGNLAADSAIGCVATTGDPDLNADGLITAADVTSLVQVLSRQ